MPVIPPNGKSLTGSEEAADAARLAWRVAELEARVEHLEKTLQDTLSGLYRILEQDLTHA